MGCNVTWYNKNFRFVYSPKVDSLGVLFPIPKAGRRFLVGAGALYKYVGEKNAETVLKAAENMKLDKHTIKFRKCGKIEIYGK